MPSGRGFTVAAVQGRIIGELRRVCHNANTNRSLAGELAGMA